MCDRARGDCKRSPACTVYGDGNTTSSLRINMLARQNDSDFCGVYINDVSVYPLISVRNTHFLLTVNKKLARVRELRHKTTPFLTNRRQAFPRGASKFLVCVRIDFRTNVERKPDFECSAACFACSFTLSDTDEMTPERKARGRDSITSVHFRLWIFFKQTSFVYTQRTSERSVPIAVRFHKTLELGDDKDYVITCGRSAFRNSR